MPSFGLTGGIASGKSTVAAMLQDLGAKIIDADQLAHELVRAGSPVFAEIVRHFGSKILDATGEINRKTLGEVVFADPAERAALNAILHPAIMTRRKELIARYEAADRNAVVISDAALIYEAHIESYFLKVIVAWCRPEQQLERLIAKTGFSREQAERRINAQMPAEEKRRRADYVVDCSGSIEETRRQVAALYPEMRRVAETKIGRSGDRAIG
ncbi:MAG TPA: dephospho-CoA kinase [Terriglobia bacterium]|nr:dephospho-CoA kinase [Terriglobia bacterium]